MGNGHKWYWKVLENAHRGGEGEGGGCPNSQYPLKYAVTFRYSVCHIASPTLHKTHIERSWKVVEKPLSVFCIHPDVD